MLACGYGWEDRGERSDEFLGLVRRLWTEPVVSHAGRHFEIRGARLDPKPVQQPHVPIIVGGHSARALRRAAELGGGWYGFALTPETAQPLLRRLEGTLAEHGRGRDGFEVVITPNSASDDDIRAFRDLGVDRLVLHLGSQRPEKVDQRLPELERSVALAG